MRAPSALLPEADAPDADPAAARLERQLRMLEELAGIGLDAARAIGRLADAEPSAADCADIALAYARVSRAVRLAVLLQSHLTRAPDAPSEAEPEVVSLRWMEPEHERIEREAGRRERIGEIVEDAARVAHGDGEAVERLKAEAVERLDRDELYREIAGRPFSEVVADICRDLGLSPDWPRLAGQAWARAEIAGRWVGQPLKPYVPASPPEARPLKRRRGHMVDEHGHYGASLWPDGA